MKRLNKLIGIAALAGLGLNPSLLFSVEAGAGAAGFLNSGVGARAAGMGGAQVAVVEDVTATYWNPAGLTRMGIYATQVGSMYSFMTLDRSLNYLAIAQHTQNQGDFGLALVHYGVDDIEVYDVVGNAQGSIKDQEMAVSLSWANLINYQFRYGITARALYHGLADSTAYGYGMDIGFVYNPSLASEFTLAANMQNPIGAISWDTGRQDEVVPNLKLGMADKYFNQRFVIAADLDIPFGSGAVMIPHVGGELWLFPQLGARAGVNLDDFTAGATWRYEFYQFDYAFTFDQRELGNTHQLSLILRF